MFGLTKYINRGGGGGGGQIWPKVNWHCPCCGHQKGAPVGAKLGVSTLNATLAHDPNMKG